MLRLNCIYIEKYTRSQGTKPTLHVHRLRWVTIESRSREANISFAGFARGLGRYILNLAPSLDSTLFSERRENCHARFDQKGRPKPGEGKKKAEIVSIWRNGPRILPATQHTPTWTFRVFHRCLHARLHFSKEENRKAYLSYFPPVLFAISLRERSRGTAACRGRRRENIAEKRRNWKIQAVVARWRRTHELCRMARPIFRLDSMFFRATPDEISLDVLYSHLLRITTYIHQR